MFENIELPLKPGMRNMNPSNKNKQDYSFFKNCDVNVLYDSCIELIINSFYLSKRK